jgi:hypothetical protein
VQHQLLKVRVGLPVEHDPDWRGPVCWRFCTVSPGKRPWTEVAALLNTHGAAAGQLQQQFRQEAAQHSPLRAAALLQAAPRQRSPTPDTLLRLDLRCMSPCGGASSSCSSSRHSTYSPSPRQHYRVQPSSRSGTPVQPPTCESSDAEQDDADTAANDSDSDEASSIVASMRRQLHAAV